MDYTQTDWNSFAKGLTVVPDEALKAMVDGAAAGESAMEAWERLWQQSAAAFGMSNEDLLRNNKMLREIAAAFVRAEVARRGL